MKAYLTILTPVFFIIYRITMKTDKQSHLVLKIYVKVLSNQEGSLLNVHFHLFLFILSTTSDETRNIYTQKNVSDITPFYDFGQFLHLVKGY